MAGKDVLPSAIKSQFSPNYIKILSSGEVMRIRDIKREESLDPSTNTPN